MLQDQGDLEGAKRCFERALKIDEKAFGPEHTSVAIDVNNLGSVLQDQGDLEGAKRCFERALKIDEKALGPEHTSVARDVNNLGLVLQAQGDLEGAKSCFERALKIDEKALGPEHTSVARDVNNLGSVLKACVATWLDQNAPTLELVHSDGGLTSDLAVIASFDPAPQAPSCVAADATTPVSGDRRPGSRPPEQRGAGVRLDRCWKRSCSPSCSRSWSSR